MATATWITGMLEQRGVPFAETHHPEVFTAQEVAQQEHISGHRLAKVVVAMVDGEPIELVMPATRRVSIPRLKEVLGAREVRLATEPELAARFADVETGAIPPLRHWEDVDVLMDASMLVEGELVFRAGTHRDAIRMPCEEWFRLVRPRVAMFTVPAVPGPGPAAH